MRHRHGQIGLGHTGGRAALQHSQRIVLGQQLHQPSPHQVVGQVQVVGRNGHTLAIAAFDHQRPCGDAVGQGVGTDLARRVHVRVVATPAVHAGTCRRELTGRRPHVPAGIDNGRAGLGHAVTSQRDIGNQRTFGCTGQQSFTLLGQHAQRLFRAQQQGAGQQVEYFAELARRALRVALRLQFRHRSLGSF